MRTLSQLIEEVGHLASKRMLNSHISYPSTKEIEERGALLSTEYCVDSTSNSNSRSSRIGLDKLINEIKGSIQLKAIDAISDTVAVLSLLYELQDSILLFRADFIVIQFDRCTLIKLRNEFNSPSLLTSICVDLSAYRRELMAYIENEERIMNRNYTSGSKSVAINNNDGVMRLGLGLGGLILSIWALWRAGR